MRGLRRSGKKSIKKNKGHRVDHREAPKLIAPNAEKYHYSEPADSNISSSR